MLNVQTILQHHFAPQKKKKKTILQICYKILMRQIFTGFHLAHNKHHFLT